MRHLLATVTVFLSLVAPANAAWTWPVSGDVITPYRNGADPYAAGQHRGIDIAAPVGAPVRAAADGEVLFAGTAGSSGLTISIRSGRYDTSYLHLLSLAVRAGARVAAGERIGAVGTTGVRSAERSHLHFGVRDAGTRHAYHDPLRFLPPPAARRPPEAPPAATPAPAPVAPAAAPRHAPSLAPRHGTSPAPRPAPSLAPRHAATPAPRSAPAPATRRAPAPRPGTVPAPRTRLAPGQLARRESGPLTHRAPGPLARRESGPLAHRAPGPLAHRAPGSLAHRAQAPLANRATRARHAPAPLADGAPAPLAGRAQSALLGRARSAADRGHATALGSTSRALPAASAPPRSGADARAGSSNGFGLWRALACAGLLLAAGILGMAKTGRRSRHRREALALRALRPFAGRG